LPSKALERAPTRAIAQIDRKIADQAIKRVQARLELAIAKVAVVAAIEEGPEFSVPRRKRADSAAPRLCQAA
jgi:hypothetical protein